MSGEKQIYPWGDSRRFYSYTNYMKRTFGGRMQKVSIDAGFTCPNRDGTKGSGGCTYCNNSAFSPAYCMLRKSIPAQIAEGIGFHKKRYRRAVGYLAYFQSYSNTYAEADRLSELYREALSFPGVRGLVIGTRPDCIDEEKVEMLKRFSDDYYVIIELGVESVYDRTLNRVNRGHTYEDSVKAIELCAAAGLNTGAHFIFGLPGESREEMMAYAAIISELPLTTVKFHQLQIIERTQMATDFREAPGNFELFGYEEYLEFFADFLERFTPSIIVERFTGEAPSGMVIAPAWGIKRSDQILNDFEKLLEERDTWQGRVHKCSLRSP